MSLRLNDLLGALSLATDVAVGVPPESALRTCLVATRLGAAIGLRGRELAPVYYASLLRHLGCTAYAHEEAYLGGGDDIALLATFEDIDAARPIAVARRTVARAGRGGGALRRIRSVGRLLASPGAGDAMAGAHCAQAVALAARLGVGDAVVGALGEIYERFDGRGAPQRVAGAQISVAARLLHVANVAEVHARLGGVDAAIAVVRRRAGSQLDPELAAAFAGAHRAVLEALDGSVWDAFRAAEPGTPLTLAPARLPEIGLAFAHYVDLKSPFTLGHSVGVAALVERAAPGDATLRLAALLHDLGRVSVPNGIWDKPGALTPPEWERVRLHPYHGERILGHAEPLRAAAAIVGLHHERLDQSGYHRGVAGASVTAAAQLLAAADVYQAMREARAHRPARSADDAARALADEAAAGRLGRAAVQQVLEAAGHAPSAIRAAWPAGLTDREAEVLRLVARGLSNKEIGVALAISAKTAQHHIAKIYEKTGVASRAAAALFATTHAMV